VLAVPEAELRTALTRGELVLHYQPVVDLRDGSVRGVEALIRWQHPVGGLLPPDDFIPAVAQTAVMPDITRWVLDTACAAAAHWPEWTVSVNITARDLATESFATDTLHALEAADVACNRLVLELTETALVQDLPRAATTLGRLRAAGIGVALDDFGTGYSSMLYLRDLPVSSVKIDREFISRLDEQGDDLAIVSSLVTLAHRVGLTAVAEGVESVVQSDLLHGLGCPLAQGYLWSRPLAFEDADDDYRNGLRKPSGLPQAKRPRRSPADAHLAQRANELLSQGASLHTIAAALNASGDRTSRGSRWHAASVAQLLAGGRVSRPG
jgi:EAL domain-containing protein (putative c-di-GMP-specific phosphodiesterase class I)